MKKVIFIIAMVVLFFGCRTPKIITTKTIVNSATSDTLSERSQENMAVTIDTSKTGGEVINYTKVEYYPPDTSVTNKKGNKIEKGAVKSVMKYSIRKKTTITGVIQTKKNTIAEKAEGTKSNIETASETIQKPGADPYRWRYIFYILLLMTIVGTVAYLWIKKNKVFLSAIGFIKRFF